MTHENMQNLCTDITIHMLHTLQQYAKGHITGTNTNQWKNHVLADSRLQFHYTVSYILYCIIFLTTQSQST